MKSEEYLAKRRIDIIESVCRILHHKPYHAITIRDIAAEIGLSYGMVHYYFKDKNALLLETVKYLDAQLNNLCVEEYNALGDGPFTKADLKQYFLRLIERTYFGDYSYYSEIILDFMMSTRFDPQISQHWKSSMSPAFAPDSPLLRNLPCSLPAEQLSNILNTYFEGLTTIVFIFKTPLEEVIASATALIDRLFDESTL